MAIFDIFKKRTPDEEFRKKVREAFEESVRDVKGKLNGDPLFDGMMIKASIGCMRKALIDAPELNILGIIQDWDPMQIIDEECKRVLHKYLE